MSISEILNLVAIVVIPIIAVLIGQYLQVRSQKRKDKMDIFKVLMASRNGWTQESVRSLNIIDIVYSDDKEVRKSWKEYFDKLCIENPSGLEFIKIQKAQYKLLETMANSLGYKDKITWETIQNPYVPKGLIEMEEKQKAYQEGQIAFVNILKNLDPRVISSFAMRQEESKQSNETK